MRTLFALAVLVLAGCGGSAATKAADSAAAPTIAPGAGPTIGAPADTSATPATTMAPPSITAPPTTPAPTTTTLAPMDKAKVAYFVLVADLNPKLDMIYKRYPNPTAKNIRALCAEVAPLQDGFARGVQAYPWPASIKPKADALAVAVAGDVGVYYQCAKAPTGGEAVDDWNAHDFNVSSNAVSAMRLALGLPIDR